MIKSRRMTYFKILKGEHSGRRPLGRPNHRWEDNIRIDVKDIDIILEVLFIRLIIWIIGNLVYFWFHKP